MMYAVEMGSGVMTCIQSLTGSGIQKLMGGGDTFSQLAAYSNTEGDF
jgi:hypothetical protein